TNKSCDTEDMFKELFTVLTDVYANDIYVENFSKRVSFTLKTVICDAPARADVKKIIGHNGKADCYKCSVMEFRVNNRMNGCGVYTTVLHRPFECLPLNMVNDFPLDPMHLVYLGVVVKLITLWMETGGNALSPQSQKLVNDRLL
ncbi:calcium-transporting atpase sarcoplasmic endoplasmic reticulum type (calcium pump), partial [Schistosoma japonicum]